MNSISVINPIGWAIERTKLVLFRPFDIGLWFTLGFCCFLAHLTQNSQSGCQGPPGNWGGPGGGGPSQNQIQNMLPTIIIFAAVILVFMIGFIMLVTWIDSRGKFMFLDGVVHRRGAVVEPWKSFRAHGNSLWKFRVTMGFLVLLVVAFILGLAAVAVIPDIQDQQFRGGSMLALFVGLPLLILVLFAAGIVAWLLIDFVVPVMYTRNLYCLQAWSVFRHELLAGHVGSFVLFFLMKILLGIAMGSIMLVGTCVTCCIAGLPYLSSVVFLPIWVFDRLYPLAFMEQFGPEWAIIARSGAHFCRWCGYDLRYSDRSGLCPECGRAQNEAAGTQPQAPPTQRDEDGEPPIE